MELVIDLFQKGGPVMWPLLACSLFSVTITIERCFFWFRVRYVRLDEQLKSIMDLAEKGDYSGAMDICRVGRNYFTRVLLEGLENREHGLDQVMQIAADKEIGRMRNGLSVLDTIITMAPLLGILGTVTGIINSFNLLGEASIENPQAVTSGIAEALITTAAGLTVALATLIPFNFFVSMVGKAARNLEAVAMELEVVCKKNNAVSVR